MRTKISEKRFGSIGKYIFVALALVGVTFFFVHGVWGELLLKAYLLTAFLLFTLLFSYWESTNEIWFWKAMIPIVLIHSVIIGGLAKLNLEFPRIDQVPRMVYGALAAVLTIEASLSIRFIAACHPEEKKREQKGLSEF